MLTPHTIFGPDLASIRGKTVRRKPTHVLTNYVNIPRDLIQLNQHVTLSADIMFVNGVPFLVSALRSINLITIENAPRHTASQLGHLLLQILWVYARAGFCVQTFFDGQ